VCKPTLMAAPGCLGQSRVYLPVMQKVAPR
jgi:hypothetical protein